MPKRLADFASEKEDDMRFRLTQRQTTYIGSVLVLLVTPLVFGRMRSYPVQKATNGKQQDPLVAQGKSRFQAYKCYDCHGQNGEGTDDAPDLTHSKLTAEQVSKFLVKPSADAQNKGMPDIPLDSPDHKPLVAYVMSLRAK
jgi:mono/diheme cytochrome c family protein